MMKFNLKAISHEFEECVVSKCSYGTIPSQKMDKCKSGCIHIFQQVTKIPDRHVLTVSNEQMNLVSGVDDLLFCIVKYLSAPPVYKCTEVARRRRRY
jgi:hypothetical protein